MAKKSGRKPGIAPPRAIRRLRTAPRDRLELPPGTFGKGAHIDLWSNRRIVVDGCRAVLHYREDCIRLNAGENVLRITGRGLEIRTLFSDQAVITGYIVGLDFCN